VLRNVVLGCWTRVGGLEVRLGWVPKQLPALSHRPNLGLLEAVLELGLNPSLRRSTTICCHMLLCALLDLSGRKQSIFGISQSS
jgi:hypothetical protein